MYDVAIIGGGLSGLIQTILLNRAGLKVVLFEKKAYPFHRVCGEYISNEVIPFLEKEKLFPHELSPARVTQFRLSSVNGKLLEMPLDLGAFGVSRYSLDHFWYLKALSEDAEIRIRTSVEDVTFQDDHFNLTLSGGEQVKSRMAVGAFGKRSKLDKSLKRSFMERRSPYVGIKYHARTNHDADVIALHNFPGGYCGISLVEKGISNICYLTERTDLKKYRDVKEFEKHILHQNPHLRQILTQAEFLFEKPLVINEISFETKAPVEQHILMTGDAAGMIAPLCGNGMAMAIHAGKISVDTILEYYQQGDFPRSELENAYANRWKKLFAQRLWTGRNVQKLFGNKLISNMAVNTVRQVKPIAKAIMKQTHGEVF
ncbi:MAG: NAD(P)/FAD-dependent oxidoreductase [Bacteroidota bacterium]